MLFLQHCGHVYDEKSVIMMLEKEKNSAGVSSFHFILCFVFYR